MMSITSEISLQSCLTSMALKAAAKKAQPAILEPMMAVEITVPEEYFGGCNGTT